MNYYKFVRRTNGTLKFISEVSNNFEDGSIYFLKDEIESIKDNFTISKMRIVKNGKTWLNYIKNK